MKGCALRGEVVPRIEISVAEELEDVAMKGVRSRLGDHINNTAGEAPVLRVHVARQNAKLGNGIKVRDNAGLLSDSLLYAGPVQVIGVVRLTLAVNRKLPGVKLSCCGNSVEAAPGAGIAGAACGNRRHARLHSEQIGIAAAIEGNIDNLFALDGLSDLRIRGLDLSRVFGDGNGFIRLSDLQNNVDAEYSVDIDVQAGGLPIEIETCRGHFQLVLAN
jgi:hypothetical protein